jgi:hypothetical protein
MPGRQLCSKVDLKIRGVNFIANLIVLESKGFLSLKFPSSCTGLTWM